MVPRVHKKGKSFKGAALYVLHDKETTESAERVDWVETRNMGTDDPQVAWRIMAATSMQQDRLKAEAGVKNTGRKSKDHVLHFTLSWDESEREELTREEMMKAVNQALLALDAADRQALIAAHNDTASPHVHVLVNRVSQEDGRLLASSYERLKLSRWAERYEKERGEILCRERVVNNKARDRGEFVRYDGHVPYHIYIAQRTNDNHPDHERITQEQRAKDAALAAAGAQHEQRRQEQWAAMRARHALALRGLAEQETRELRTAENTVRSSFRPQWEALSAMHNEQLRTWETNERQFLGRIRNAVAATDWKAMMQAGDRRERLRDAYGAFSSSGARLEALKRQQEAEERALHASQLTAEREHAATIRRRTAQARVEHLTLFDAERHSMTLTHDLEHAALRSSWRQRNLDRRRAYEDVDRSREPQHEGEPAADKEQSRHAGLSPAEQQWLDRYTAQRESANDNTQEQSREQ